MPNGANHVDWVLLDPSRGQGPVPGDLISADAGGMPVYQCLDVQDRRARVRDDHGSEHVIPVARFRWKAVAG
ncbi:MAG TPA: hypothetical protein VG939_14265 [Caulobacteraceae bacterium]|nr:hypothetical protein [Caulobacteraceae bacterium]